MNRLIFLVLLLTFQYSLSQLTQTQQRVSRIKNVEDILKSDRPVRLETLSECHSAKERAERSKNVLKLIPKCEENGEYSALQCHHGSKFCQCWRPDGTPITQPSSKTRMCECHMEKDRVEKTVGSPSRGLPPGAFSPKCNEDGSYKSLQCHGSTGYCWCVDPKGRQTSEKKRQSIQC